MDVSTKRTVNDALWKWNMVQNPTAPLLILLSALWALIHTQSKELKLCSECENRYISTNNLTRNNHVPGGACLPLMWFLRSSQKAEHIPVLFFDDYFCSSTSRRKEMRLDLQLTEQDRRPPEVKPAVPTYWRTALDYNFIKKTALKINSLRKATNLK